MHRLTMLALGLSGLLWRQVGSDDAKLATKTFAGEASTLGIGLDEAPLLLQQASEPLLGKAALHL